ncbi:MAG: 6-phosphofructokinase, partial [Candidatus Bipolaricaulota bacterium]
MKRIGVLTSGGDAPGMNAAIRATVRQGRDLGLETVGISFGYKGLLEGNFQNYQIEDVGGIIERGGTVLQSKRAPEFRKRDVRAQAIRNLNKQDIEGLIVIGGDGTLNGAKALHEEGIPVIGIPASIDNDIYVWWVFVGEFFN